MSKLRLTFEVDTIQLFDMIKKMRFGTPDGNGAAMIGTRIAGVMMTGEASFADAMGMAVYGVALVDAEKVE